MKLQWAAWFLPVLVLLLFSVILLLAPATLWAAPLTDAQYATLKNDILVTHQAEFATAVADNDDQTIANAYNADASPAYWVWRTSLTDKEIYEITTTEGTTWDWTTYIQQTVQERDAWDQMFRPGTVNPSLPQTRAGWQKIFGGQGAPAVQLTHLLTVGRRHALRIEALLVLSGAGTTATPSVMGFEGTITRRDVAHALRDVPLF